jgi:hypothetical protein
MYLSCPILYFVGTQVECERSKAGLRESAESFNYICSVEGRTLSVSPLNAKKLSMC